MNLNQCREEIDKINDEILDLFIKRMNLAAQVADYKKENNLPVMQKDREIEILNHVAKKSGTEFENYSTALFSDIMSLSRAYQSERNGIKNSEIAEKIQTAIKNEAKAPSANAVIACQGIEGAYSSLAADKLFPDGQKMYFRNFDAVFSAIEKGLCSYGILPIENSLYGSVNQVYDLMKNHNFYISKGVKLKISHVLLGKKGAKLSSITDIYSHEQAIGQCSSFLSKNPNITVHICENTAIAARIAANDESGTVASISSPECAELYGLEIIEKNIANAQNNHTRFICISKNLEISSDASKISLMLQAQHKPGSLYALISRFAALGLNITKLESRPIAGQDFEYLFYFDIEGSVYNERVLSLISELVSDEDSVFLGNYSEI